jgi:hypothetical protein
VKIMHIDKDTLELLALEAAFDSREITRLKRHLSSCADCRNRLAEIREFYGAAEKEYLELRKSNTIRPSTALASRSQSALAPAIFEQYVDVHRQPRGFVSRLYIFARSRPFVSGLGAMVIMASFALGLNYLFLRGTVMNPEYVHVNLERMSMDVYSQKDELIWNKPIGGSAGSIQVAMDRREELSQVADVNHDGKKEVVTTYTLDRNGTNPLSSLVTVFNWDGSISRQRSLAILPSYRGEQYDSTFMAQGVLVLTGADESGTQIFVCLQNRRSPFALVRLDGRLNQLGAYWHFGHLHGPLQMTMADGHRVLLLWGIDDEATKQGVGGSTLVVLDPSKIIDVSESSATPGFGFPTSGAELYYIRFPDPDFVASISASSDIRRIEGITENSIHLMQFIETADESFAGIEYVLDQSWRVTQVKPISGFDAHYRKLEAGGIVSTQLSPDYFTALGHGVRYWDGHTWVGHSTEVKVAEKLSGNLGVASDSSPGK